MMTDLEQQIRQLAASRIGGNGPQPLTTDAPTPSIFYWLEQIRESLADMESLAGRSEALSLVVSGRDTPPPKEEKRDVSQGTNLSTSIEVIAHRLKMANSRIDIALTVSERAIGGTNS